MTQNKNKNLLKGIRGPVGELRAWIRIVLDPVRLEKARKHSGIEGIDKHLQFEDCLEPDHEYDVPELLNTISKIEKRAFK